MQREYSTPPQKSRESGIKLDNIMAAIHSGELRAYNTARDPEGERPRWRIRESDWEAFLEGRANRKPEPVKPARRRRKAKSSRQWV